MQGPITKKAKKTEVKKDPEFKPGEVEEMIWTFVESGGDEEMVVKYLVKHGFSEGGAKEWFNFLKSVG